MKKTLSWCLISTLTLSSAAACSNHQHNSNSPKSEQSTTTEGHGGDHSAHESAAGHDHTDENTPTHTNGHSGSHAGHHHHAPLEVPSDIPAPGIDLQISEDAVQGWNLELQVTNFSFAPENVNKTSEFNEGHAHLYIDGEKIARLYSPWYHLASLEPGEHVIRVTLNANGHEELQVNGETVADSETIIVSVSE